MRELLAWQPEGVEHLITEKPEMEGRKAALLAAEMGLGKTDMSVAAAKRLNAKTMLIICPLGVIETWVEVLKAWNFCHESEIWYAENTRHTIPKDKKAIIVNYEKLLVKPMRTQILKRRFDVLVIDECQRLKSLSSRTTKIMYRGQKSKKGYIELPIASICEWRFLLSGTPVPNDAIELYPHLKALASPLLGKYDTYEKFGNRYSYRGIRNGEIEYYGSQNVAELREMIKPFMLSMRAVDVFPDMPDVLIEPVYLNIHFNEIGGDESDTHLATLRGLVGLAKVPHVVQYAKDRLAINGEKHLIYTYSREVTEQICDKLAMHGAVKIYGGMSFKAKAAAKRSFIENPNVKFMVLQMISGGTGVDGLQKVCYNTIFAEWDWTGGGYKQQIARLRRLFQKSKTVYVHALIALKTLDERIIRSRKRKVSVIDTLLKGEKRMDLIKLLESIDASLKALVAQGKSTVPSAKSTTSGTSETKAESVPSAGTKKEEKKEKEITSEDLRAAAKEFVEGGLDELDEEDKAAAIEDRRGELKKILNKFGAKGDKPKIADVKGANVAKVHAALSNAIEARAEAEGDAEQGEGGDDY